MSGTQKCQICKNKPPIFEISRNYPAPSPSNAERKRENEKWNRERVKEGIKKTIWDARRRSTNTIKLKENGQSQRSGLACPNEHV
jgi:hypothetical protein